MTLVKSSTIKFRLNERFEEKTIDDRIVESIFSTVENDVDDNQNDEKSTKSVELVQKQVDKVK